ncbi:MAG: phosphoglycerate dehydrogenase [Planctomycetales bacterium]|nr:phosphoglycerate dehydrogenase [Planctomycetales bacterium]
MPKVVCTALNTQHGPHIDIFQKAGFEIDFAPDGVSFFEADNLIRMLKDADAVVAGSEPYTRHVLQSLPKLRVIARSGVGFDAIDLAACDERDIPVCTTPGVNHDSVAEHTIAMLMGLVRGFPELDRKVRKNQWKRVSHPRAMGRTLGILGLGRIGQAVAWRAVGLGIKVIAYELYPNQEFVKKWNIELLDLDTLLARSDFVSLHLPMSKENFQLMNRERFAKMKKGAIVINTARGPLIHEADLCEALKSGQLAGAGLDVFHTEPLPLTSPLLELDNVLLAGHVAGLDDESAHDTAKMYAEIIVGLWNGRWPEGCVQNLKGRTGWKW